MSEAFRLPDSDVPPPIGHNAPPSRPMTPSEIRLYLTVECSSLAERAQLLIDASARFLEKYPTIETEDQQAAATENLAMMRKVIALAEEKRKDFKEPYLEGGRAVDKWFGSVKESVDAAAKKLEAPGIAYAKRLEAVRRAAAEAEAERLAEEARQLEEQASDAQEFDIAAKAAKEAEDAAKLAHGRPGPLSRTVGAYGSTSSLQTRWTHEVTDPAKVERKYCVPSDTLIAAAVRGGLRKAEGIRIFEAKKLRTR